MSSIRDHSVFKPVTSLTDYQIAHCVPLFDGSSVAIATSEESQKVFVLLFQDTTIKRRHELDSALWSADGNYSLSVIPDNQHVAVWNLNKTKECGIVFINIFTGSKVSSAKVDDIVDEDSFIQMIPTANGKQLFVRSFDSGIQIWDIENLKDPKRISHQKIAYSDRRGFLLLPDGRHFYSFLDKVYSLGGGEVQEEDCHSSIIISSIIGIDSKNKKIYVTSDKLACFNDCGNIFAITPDAQHFFVGTNPYSSYPDPKISIFNIADIKKPKLISEIPLDYSPRVLAVSSDGTSLVAYHMKGTIGATLWNLSDLKNPLLVETTDKSDQDFCWPDSIFIKSNGQVVTDTNYVIPITALMTKNKEMREAKQDDEKSTFSPS